MIKKNAFTLAETLIVLIIIGVIAALTVPAIMFNTNKRISMTGYKRALSSLNQAVDMSRTELKFQPQPKCFNGGTQSQCSELWDYLKDVMQVQKYCKEKSIDSGCMPKDYEKSNCLKTLNDTQSFVTTDGMIYFSSGNGAMNIGVDTNGTRGPNKAGYDVFYVVLNGTSSTMQLYAPAVGCVDDGGVAGTTLIKDKE